MEPWRGTARRHLRRGLDDPGRRRALHHQGHRALPSAARHSMTDDFRILLRLYRDRRRWSQVRCAEQCEMDHSLVSRLETGERLPTAASIAKLCAGLGLSPEDADRLWISAGLI